MIDAGFNLTGAKVCGGLAVCLVLGLGLTSGPSLSAGQASEVASPGAISGSPVASIATPTPRVTAIGVVEPGEGIVYVSATSFLNTFVVGKVLVAEGEAVSKGQTLARLDVFDDFEAVAGVASKAVDAARERLSFAQRMMRVGEVPAQEARVQLLQAELDYLEADQKRNDSLRSRNLVSSADQEAVRSRRQAKAQEVQEARHLHRSLKEKWEGEQRQAEIALGQAEFSLKKAQAELELCQVRAPVAGHVLEILTHAGEAIRGKGILALGETDRMYAVAEVYQSDVPKIGIGSKAVVTADGFSWKLNGVVERIGRVVLRNQLANPDVASDIDCRVVKVRVRLDHPEHVANLSNLRVIVTFE